MNNNKLKKLFELARNETAPIPPQDFATDVARAIRLEPQAVAAPPAFSLFDQLNLIFPRIALAAAAVIVLCVAADYGLTAAGVPELGDASSQVSMEQFLSADDSML